MKGILKGIEKLNPNLYKTLVKEFCRDCSGCPEMGYPQGFFEICYYLPQAKEEIVEILKNQKKEI